MSGLDLSRLSPGDSITALRSYPRRMRETIAELIDETQDPALIYARVPSGVSALDIMSSLPACWDGVARAMDAIRHDDHAFVEATSIQCSSPAVSGRAGSASAVYAPAGSGGPGADDDIDVNRVLDRVDDSCRRLVDAASRFSGRDWKREATTTSGETIDALAVLHRAVAAGRETLDLLVVTLAEVAGR